jgi:hypothetical protein
MYTTGVLRVDELIFGFGAHANGDGCGTHGSNDWSVLFIMYFIFYTRATTDATASASMVYTCTSLLYWIKFNAVLSTSMSVVEIF